jgi:protein SCO1/2
VHVLTRKYALSLLAAAALLLMLRLAPSAVHSPGERLHGTVLDPPPPAADFAGTNWDGEAFTLRALRGRVVVLSFGYTSCPDVCPATLSRMKALRARLGRRAEDLAVVFVTVDPLRDSVSRLAGYVPSFDRAFYGVHLLGEPLVALKAAYGIAATKREGGGGQYYVDHSGVFLLIDAAGRLRTRLPLDTTLDDMVADVETLLAEAGDGRSVVIEDARGRRMGTGAVLYMRIVNPGPEADRLLAVETTGSGTAEIHETVIEGEMVRMLARPEGFTVPAGSSVELRPGGIHVMLVGMEEARARAEPLTVRLRFERAGPVEIHVPITGIGWDVDQDVG